MFSANSSQVSDDKLFVEDVFSTYLYSGTSGAQSINNGIDTLNKGGLVWMKNRGSALSHILIDTAQGCTFAGGKNLISNSTNAAGTIAANTFQFDSTGFSFGSAASGGAINASGNTYASWTFRKAPKFFDVVTYTGNGAENRVLSHALGSVPGTMIIKRTDSTGNWDVWHRAFSYYLGTAPSVFCMGRLEETTQFGYSEAQRLGAAPTSTSFTLGPNVNGAPLLNASGATYVAYLFAHDTTSDGIIQCGSFTTDGSGNATVSLGWEPQWVMVKASSDTSNWAIGDVMRGFSQTQFNFLRANTTNTELTSPSNPYTVPTATGFSVADNSGNFFVANTTYIYIAIRRGPMRTPTSGTSVFMPVTATNPSSPYTVTTNFPVDLSINTMRNLNGVLRHFMDRLRGGTTTTYTFLNSASTAAEVSGSGSGIGFQNNTAIIDNGWMSGAGFDPIYYNFRRAPSFFDEVCYTGTGVARTVNHNLGVAPELMIVKSRVGMNSAWRVYAAPLGATQALRLETPGAATSATIGGEPMWNNTAPTSTVFSLGTSAEVNNSGVTWVAYLFASCPGVSEVFSFTGNGSSQTINCGFAAGARFVMIKRTDSTGDWWVWDTARGLVSGNDPALRLNSTAAETTGIDSIDPDSSGFIVNQDATTNINVNGASYIGLAVA